MSNLPKPIIAGPLTEIQLQQFMRDGYLIVRKLASTALCQRMIENVETSLKPALGPLEYESDVRYPGAPVNQSAPGGFTPRRLLNAYARDAVFRQWAGARDVVSAVKQLVGTDNLLLTQNHHNCIMTKMPEYSSKTGWHQDIRYWSFDRPELVNVWLALGDEYSEKGGMKFIPGSHKLELDRGRFDADLFAGRIDEAHLWDPNAFVDPGLLDRSTSCSYVSTKQEPGANTEGSTTRVLPE